MMKRLSFALSLALLPFPVLAAPANVDFTVAMSEAVTVSGCPATCPRIAVDVGGQTRYAQYSAGSGSSSLTFSYAPTIGDLDLDGVTLSSPVDLNGGTMTDLNGNPITNLTFTVPNTTGIKINYPSLSMDFTNGASGRYTLNGTAYTDFSSFRGAASGTFSRATAATYYDSTGTLQTAATNTPRFDHDPITLVPKGILIEELRVNFLPRSQEFDHVTWTKYNTSVIANSMLAPNNTNTADILSRTSTASNYAGIGLSKATSSITYTSSIFVKYNSARYLALRVQGSHPARADVCFDLQTGTITYPATAFSGFSNASAAIVPLSNGWFRVFLIATSDTASGFSFLMTPRNTSGILDASDTLGSGSVYVWGAQTEKGAFPTSYIPTISTSLARAADNLKIPTGSWHNASAQTLYGKASSDGASAGSGSTIADINNNSFNERYQIRFQGGPQYGGIVTTGGGYKPS